MRSEVVVAGWTRTRRVWLLLGVAVSLGFLPRSVLAVLRDDHPGWAKALLLTAVAAFGVGGVAVPWTSRRVGERTRVAGCAALLVLGSAITLALGPDASSAVVFAAALTALMLPSLWVLALDGAVVAVFAVLTVFDIGLTGGWGALTTLVSVTMALGFIGRLTRTVRELRRARDEIATLAAAAERNRVARDLHDLLGHSLTTITVKASLARRVLERGDDPGRALAEVRELEELARQATQDVRAAVSGYREVTLAAELAGAGAALRAAGVTAELPSAVDTVAPALRGVFGHVVREATTNVLRHSGASRCTVRLGPDWVEVRDDGRGGAAGAPGSGLAGLRERLAEVGGALEAGPLPQGGFRLRAVVPSGVVPSGGVPSGAAPSDGVRSGVVPS
ncbi:sensor histidine kinase [Actinokineospora bangkokensis]|uniref:sensor histidine kinase n=1 Tax=Actinokineospora bangkokensis TaxID=1193682 RepID=UPI001E49676B|nr:histidine kinase [Actinokineospora bangkokensis]